MAHCNRCHCSRQPLVCGCSPHSPVLRPACGLLKRQMQFTAVLSDHVDLSFLLSSPLLVPCIHSRCIYTILGVSFVFHQMSKVSYTAACFVFFIYYSNSDI